MANASRDENRVPSLVGSSNDGNRTPVDIWADPTLHRLLVSAVITSAVAPKEEDRYGIVAISEDATYKYFWYEANDADYYIMRKHKTTNVFTFTKGTGGYATVYQSEILGPSGSPTWASRGNTF